MISQLGMASRVLSLTTIGTPHHGSPIADEVIKAGKTKLTQLAEHLGCDVKGITDLTTTACADFNATTPDVPSVSYFSVAGQFEPWRIIGIPLGI